MPELSVRPKNGTETLYIKNVNICPMCKYAIIPKVICSYFHNEDNNLSLYCECTHCEKPFIVYLTYFNNNHTVVEYIAPEIPNKITFNKHIHELSNNFVSIYNEANCAEAYHLSNIAGIGYRKALEFLIKDYCIYKTPDDSEKIKSILLGQVISQYISSDKIKNLAKASVWLGNDQTHYTRKFESKDLKDLKTFIDATVNFIVYELISDEAETLLSES